jgi:hypothetical protein
VAQRYSVFSRAHKTCADSAAWVASTLDGVDRSRIVSVSQSSCADSGPGYSFMWIITTIVLTPN